MENFFIKTANVNIVSLFLKNPNHTGFIVMWVFAVNSQSLFMIKSTGPFFMGLFNLTPVCKQI